MSMPILRLLSGAAADFQRHGCTSLAASLAFFALLSFFPAVFLLLYVVSFLVAQDQIGDQFLMGFLETFLPRVGDALAEEIKRVAGLQAVRWLVFLAFVWFGGLVFYEVEYAVNVVFETPRRRHPVVSTLVALALFGLAEVLLILSYLVTLTMSMAVRYAPQFAGMDLAAVAAKHLLVGYALPFSLVFAAMMCLYRFVPRPAPAWQNAAIGALVLALLWELAKHLFGGYVRHLSIYGRMYGSLLEVVLFLLWVYYSAALFLFGAAIVNRLERRG
jgi:membrane protein